jgi:hypothetical protein
VRQYAAHLGPHTFELAPSAKARVLSHWVDVSGVEQGPAAVALELPGGERLGLLPFEIQSVSPALLQMARREQWASLFEWAGREVLPIRVTGGENVYPQLFSDPDRGGCLLALANLSADDAAVTLAGPAVAGVIQAERLLDTGEWVIEDDTTHLQVKAWSLTVVRF